MKIQQKFFLIQCCFSLVLLTTLVLLIQWSIRNGMVDYVNSKEIESLSPVITELSEEYKESGDWSGLKGKQGKFIRLIQKQLNGDDSDLRPSGQERRRLDQDRNNPPRRPHRPPPSDHFEPRFGPEDDFLSNSRPPIGAPEVYYALFDCDQDFLVGKYLDDLTYSKVPVLVNKKIVGYFAVSKRSRLTEGYELDYIEKQQEYLWVIALVMMLFVVLITLPLTRHVVEPIKLIARGMNRLTQGDYKQTIDSKRDDEFGELSRDYNELALTLAENESARKRWLANISHELRTPVAILGLELEAMLDGIRPLTKENIISASDELKHLAKLIDDLHQLTVADVGGMQYSKQNENLTLLLINEQNKYQSYLADAGINLTLDLISEPINIYGDKTRLLQLFENILNNTVKYSEASMVKMSSRLIKSEDKPIVELIIEDNGVGVDDEHLERLFEYLYRTDESRNRKTGGAGLGLSICYNIVLAHQGEISAMQSDLGGLAIHIKLPLA
ncbi:ATP-binding protein [Pseudocolwellia agarivorans]|uniref:ATP-binding protein n=1 Tax=Pseudocolwellia agarivorans TaxID=1911682 RepID=UPI003F8834D0